MAIHKVTGMAALFGFHSLGEAAFAAESHWLEAGAFGPADLADLAEELRGALQDGA
jgi:hypothetical protein